MGNHLTKFGHIWRYPGIPNTPVWFVAAGTTIVRDFRLSIRVNHGFGVYFAPGIAILIDFPSFQRTAKLLPNQKASARYGAAIPGLRPPYSSLRSLLPWDRQVFGLFGGAPFTVKLGLSDIWWLLENKIHTRLRHVETTMPPVKISVLEDQRFRNSRQSCDICW